MLIRLIKDIPFQDNSPACDLHCSCKIMADKKQKSEDSFQLFAMDQVDFFVDFVVVDRLD